MPVSSRSNNKILPANTRAVDVAQRALRDLTAVQQRKYHNAFMVQGYEAIIYSRLKQGIPCSCQARRKSFASLLDQDGKMSEGSMNEILTGGLEFTVNRYGATSKPTSDASSTTLGRDDQFFGDSSNENSTPFVITGKQSELSDPYIDVTDLGGVNGPHQEQDLDDAVPVFDADIEDFRSTKCGCCFGTGFVGGFSIVGGLRLVLNTRTSFTTDDHVDVNLWPNAFYGTDVTFKTVLPMGYVSLDAFKVWNNLTPTSSLPVVTIDGLPFSAQLLAAFCDGRPHDIRVRFAEPTYFTHVEIQINLSRQPALLEFPKLSQGSDISLMDLTDTVQIEASPLIPKLETRDIIVESTFGKSFIVMSSNRWNDRDRNVHGWDCQARVLQPSEMLSALPRRRQLVQKSSSPVRDNSNGIRRT